MPTAGLSAAIVVALTASACDAPERTTRQPGIVAGPKGDQTQDGRPGEDEEGPVFLLPDESLQKVALGSGQCVEISMELSDDVADELEISVDAPSELGGATLTEDARGFSAHWRWCPGAFGAPPKPGEYEVMLLADDGVHLPTTRAYTVVVDEAEPEPEPEPPPEDEPHDCDVGWPTIDYQPPMVGDGVVSISALFVDDIGIVGFPFVEFTFDTPDELHPEFTSYPMELVDGDRKAGVWRVEVPIEGDTLYYRFIAEDSVPGQPCPHLLEEPTEGFLEVGL